MCTEAFKVSYLGKLSRFHTWVNSVALLFVRCFMFLFLVYIPVDGDSDSATWRYRCTS